MILRKSQVHLPSHKIGLIEFQTLRLFCGAEMLSSLFCSKGLESHLLWYICVYTPRKYAIITVTFYYNIYYSHSFKRRFGLLKGVNDWVSRTLSASMFMKGPSGRSWLGHELLPAWLSCPQDTREAPLDFTSQIWLPQPDAGEILRHTQGRKGLTPTRILLWF